MVDIGEKVAGLTGSQATAALNRLVEGYVARHPEFPVGDLKSLAGILQAAGKVAGENVSPRVDVDISNSPAAARAILLELAAIPDQKDYVEGAIEVSRTVLIDPITAALIMTGIILVLETQFDVNISHKDGKTEYDVKLGKKPTDKSLIGKLFGLFS